MPPPEAPSVGQALAVLDMLRKTISGQWVADDEETAYRVAELRAFISSAEQAGAWQPIETGPRDGTWVLLYSHQLGIADYPVVAFWDDGWQSVRSDTPVFRATHWRQLPAPPAIDAARATQPAGKEET